MVRTDSGTSYRLSKSDKPPCPAERQQQLGEYTDRPRSCQPWFLRFPQEFLGGLRTPFKDWMRGLCSRFEFSTREIFRGAGILLRRIVGTLSEIMRVSDLVNMNITTKASFNLDHLKP